MFKGNKKGTLTFYLFAVVAALMILIVAAVISPIGVAISTAAYEAGEEIMLGANDTLADIDNETIRDSIAGSMEGALGATEANIEVFSAGFQYGWVLFVFIVGIIVFVLARRQVEIGGGLI